jgi:hypothetical protein
MHFNHQVLMTSHIYTSIWRTWSSVYVQCDKKTTTTTMPRLPTMPTSKWAQSSSRARHPSLPTDFTPLTSTTPPTRQCQTPLSETRRGASGAGSMRNQHLGAPLRRYFDPDVDWCSLFPAAITPAERSALFLYFKHCKFDLCHNCINVSSCNPFLVYRKFSSSYDQLSVNHSDHTIF